VLGLFFGGHVTNLIDRALLSFFIVAVLRVLFMFAFVPIANIINPLISFLGILIPFLVAPSLFDYLFLRYKETNNEFTINLFGFLLIRIDKKNILEIRRILS
jgi:hypothetical protein